MGEHPVREEAAKEAVKQIGALIGLALTLWLLQMAGTDSANITRYKMRALTWTREVIEKLVRAGGSAERKLDQVQESLMTVHRKCESKYEELQL